MRLGGLFLGILLSLVMLFLVGVIGLKRLLSPAPAALQTFPQRRMRRILKNTLREIFQAWRIVALLARALVLQAQLEDAQSNQRNPSIWTMKKAELIEVARRELSLRPDEAQAKSAVELRELLRAHREKLLSQQDPRNRLPPGLVKMRKDQLMQECALRDIVTERITRAQMISAIRSYVEAAGGEATMEDTEWGMADSA